MILTHATSSSSVRRRRGVESLAIVNGVTVVDIEVAEMGDGGPGAM
jgi:hypothetical protein